MLEAAAVLGAGAGLMGPWGVCGVPERWLLCLAGLLERATYDEPAGGSAGGFFLVPALPGPFLSLKLLPHPWGGLLGSCHLLALPQGYDWGDTSSILGWRMGTRAGPSLLGWSGCKGGV